VWGWQPYRHLWAYCLDNVGPSTSHNQPYGPSRSVTGIALLYFTFTASEACETARNISEQYKHGYEIGAAVHLTTVLILRPHNSNWHHCSFKKRKVNHYKVKWSWIMLVQCRHIGYCTEPHSEVCWVQDVHAILTTVCFQPTIFNKERQFYGKSSGPCESLYPLLYYFPNNLAELEGIFPKFGMNMMALWVIPLMYLSFYRRY
jgi:hypothetical protein